MRSPTCCGAVATLFQFVVPKSSFPCNSQPADGAGRETMTLLVEASLMVTLNGIELPALAGPQEPKGYLSDTTRKLDGVDFLTSEIRWSRAFGSRPRMMSWCEPAVRLKNTGSNSD